MQEPKNKVTMEHIAKKLGVSKVSVYKALSNRYGISEELRDKIKKEAKKTGYKYTRKTEQNLSAVGLMILVPELFLEHDENFYTRIYKDLCVHAEKSNCFTILQIIKKSDELELKLPTLLSNGIVKGIIVCGQLNCDYIKELEKAGFPIVLTDFYYRNISIDSVITDNLYASYEAVTYLVKKGHKDIGFVGNYNTTSSIQDRYLGYMKAMLENRLKTSDELVFFDKDNEGNETPIDLSGSLPTAFFCNSDRTAFLLMKTLKENNMDIPNDFSIIGFDDVIHSIMANPKLTSIRVNRKEMARNVLEIILKRINQVDLPVQRILVPAKIVERDSVKELI